MKIIEKLSNMIEDELDGAKCYAEKAIELKDTDKRLSTLFNNLSEQEMNHMNQLHAEVVRLIDECRQKNVEPPAGMMTLYEYLHKKHIDKAAKIKSLQALYRE